MVVTNTIMTMMTLLLSSLLLIATTMVVASPDSPNITWISGGLHTDGTVHTLADGYTQTGYLTITGEGFDPAGNGQLNGGGYMFLEAASLNASTTSLLITGQAVSATVTPTPTPQCITWPNSGGEQSACYYYDAWFAPSVTGVTSSSCTTSGSAATLCEAGSSAITFTITGNDFGAVGTYDSDDFKITIGTFDCSNVEVTTAHTVLTCSITPSFTSMDYNRINLPIVLKRWNITSTEYPLVSFALPTITAGSFGNYESGGSGLEQGHGYVIKTLDASQLGIAGTFDGVTDGTLSFAGLSCAYSSSDSSSTLWVCNIGSVLGLSSPPSLVANYTPSIDFTMSGGATISYSLTDIITFVGVSLDSSSLVINSKTPSSSSSADTFGTVSIELSANEWSLTNAAVTVGLPAADGGVYEAVDCTISSSSTPVTLKCDLPALTNCTLISLYLGKSLYIVVRGSSDPLNANYNRMVRSTDSFTYPSAACPAAASGITVTAPVVGQFHVIWSHGSGNTQASLLPYSIEVTSTATYLSPLFFTVNAAATLSIDVINEQAILSGETFTIKVVTSTLAGIANNTVTWTISSIAITPDATSLLSCSVSDVMVGASFNCSVTARASSVIGYGALSAFVASGWSDFATSANVIPSYLQYSQVFPVSFTAKSSSSFGALSVTPTSAGPVVIRVYDAPVSSTISCDSTSVVAGATASCHLYGYTAGVGSANYTLASAYSVALTQVSGGTSSITSLSPAIVSAITFSFTFTAGSVADTVTIHDSNAGGSFVITVTVPTSSSSSSSSSSSADSSSSAESSSTSDSSSSSSSTGGVSSSTDVSSSTASSSTSTTDSSSSSTAASSSTSDVSSSSSSSSTGSVVTSSSSSSTDVSSSSTSDVSSSTSVASSSSSSTGSGGDQTITGGGTITFVIIGTVADSDRSGTIYTSIRDALLLITGIDSDRIIESFVAIVRNGLTGSAARTTVTIGITPATAASPVAASTYVATIANTILQWQTNQTSTVLAGSATWNSLVDAQVTVTNQNSATIYCCNGVYQTTSCTPTNDDSEDWWNSSDPIGIGLSFVICVIILAAIVLVIIIAIICCCCYCACCLPCCQCCRRGGAASAPAATKKPKAGAEPLHRGQTGSRINIPDDDYDDSPAVQLESTIRFEEPAPQTSNGAMRIN